MMPPIFARTRAVLFDLDGTLLDTAPDMIGAVNALRAEEQCAPLPADELRPFVSHGSHGLVRAALGHDDAERFERHRERFLALYAARLTRDTVPFLGMPEVLAALESAGLLWGVVTNKPAWLTDPLLAHLGLAQRAACVISGDTLAERKPHPLPLLHAAAQMSLAPVDCLYVGDAERDMQSAAAANMPAVLARYGYIGAHDAVDQWTYHRAIDRPLELFDLLPALTAERARA
jgi:N-acetyl-D-muramate 6-phosphate phosphatase